MRFQVQIPFPIKVAAAIVFLPALIPVAIVMVAVDNRRKRKAAAAFHCLRCARVLGVESLRIADSEFRKQMDELRRSNPFTKFSIVRTCDAICPACGTRYAFRNEDRTFVLEARHPDALGKATGAPGSAV
jgi:hypothetical protein